MANIRQYGAPEGLSLQPTEIGVEATAAAARRGGAFFNQVAGDLKSLGSETAQAGEQAGRMANSAIQGAGRVAVEHVDREDRSKVSTAMTGGLTTLEKDWQQTLNGNGLDPKDPNYIPPANPNDSTIAEKFQKDKVEPFLESLSNIPFGENGQKYAENKAAELRQHLSHKMTADMSTQAGNAIVLNRLTTMNNLGSLVSTDPSFGTVDFAIKQSRDDMQHHIGNPNLNADQVGKLKIHQAEAEQKLVHAAANAAISKSPDPEGAARAFIKRYPDLIKGDEANTFAKSAKAQLKANNYYDRQSAILEKQQADLSVHKESTNLIANSVSVDPNNPSRILIAPDFAKRALDIARNNPNAPSASATVRTMIDWGESQQNKENVVRSDPTLRQELLSRIGSSTNPTSEIEILRAEADHKISRTDSAEMRALHKAVVERPEGEVIKRARTDFLKAQAMIIDPQFDGADLGKHSALGLQRTYDYEMAVRRQEDFARSKGADPLQVYDRKSPYYVDPASYRASMQEINNYNAKLKADDKVRATPPKPGERKEFKQGWGVWNGKEYVPEGAK